MAAESRSRGWYVWHAHIFTAFLAGGDWWLPCPGCGRYGRLCPAHEAIVGYDGALTLRAASPLPNWLHYGLTCPSCGWYGTIVGGAAVKHS